MAKTTTKIFPRSQRADSGKDPNKELGSAAIAAHLAAFEAAGGTIEVLGTTRVLQRIDGVTRPAEAQAGAASAKGGAAAPSAAANRGPRKAGPGAP